MATLKLVKTGLSVQSAMEEARQFAVTHNQPYSVLKLNKRACGQNVYGVYEGMPAFGHGTAVYVARPAALPSAFQARG
jgi:hypothetical protein